MSRFFRSLAAIFMPPFNGLGLVVVLYVVWAHLVYPHNDVIRGNLPDTDDYMYLVQVLDWLKGQGWYDNIQHRLNPPDGVPIHFSRLVQIPLAAGILFFEKLGLPPQGAATVTALIEPLVLLGFCLSTLRRVAAHVVPARWAGASAYVALFSVALLFEFMPGHVDHHGLVIILVLASLGCILRLMDEPENAKAAAAAGLILAATMMIALEILPWVLLLSAWLGLCSLKQGGAAARSGAAFAVSYLAGSIVCLALTRPPATGMEIDVLTYSIVYVLLAACIAAPFIGAALAAETSPALRGTIGIALAALCGGLFLHRFPELATGPYGAIDPQLVPLLLDTVEESRPILQTDNGVLHMINYMSMGFIALPAAFFFARQERGKERAKWGLIGLLLAAAIGLTIFYQYRFLGMETALTVIPLTALLQRGWNRAGRSLEGRKKVLAEIGLLLLVGPLPSLIVPALFDSRSFNLMLLFPVDSSRSACDMARLETVLRDPVGLDDGPHLIASTMELGPELLFRSSHSVLAAPFHMNVQGNLDAARLLSTPYPAEAERIARRRGVDLIVACRAVPKLYLTPKDEPPSVIETLFTGPAPAWLERAHAPGVDNFVVYRVLPPQSAPDAKKTQGKKYPSN